MVISELEINIMLKSQEIATKLIWALKYGRNYSWGIKLWQGQIQHLKFLKNMSFHTWTTFSKESSRTVVKP